MSLGRKMWFGTKQFARWIKVHSPGSEYAANGYGSSIAYLNGGIGQRRSLSGHETRQLTWNRLTEQESRDITDFAFGTYGNGPFYLSDPAAASLNALNKNWSMPALSGKDGVPLAGRKRPELVPNPDQSHGYPVEMAKYTVDNTAPRRSFYVPVPPGHTAWVGAHGDASSALGLTVQPTVSGTPVGAATTVPVVGVNTDERVTDAFPATSDQAGIELSLETRDSVVNLFTNPSFEAAAGTVEVRRNLNPTPNWSQAFTGWSVGNLTDGGAVAGGRKFSGTAVLPNINRNSASALTVPAAQFMQGWMVKVAATSPAVTFINRVVIGSTDVRQPGVTVQPGETAYIAHIFAAPSGTIRPVLEVSNPGGAAFEFTVLDGVTVESTARVQPAFSGTFSPDIDLTPSWTGAANSSPSILSGVPVSGLGTLIGGVAIRSTRWAKSGAYSVRLITRGANGCYATVLAPAGLHTVFATAHLEAPLPLAGGLFPSLSNGTVTDPVPNVAGDHDLRITAERNTALGGFVLAGGATVGDSVWYDCAGVVAGDYDGPWFSGDSPGAHWTGDANASTSVRDTFTTTLAGLIVQVLPTGRVPERGKFISGQGMSGADFDGIVRPTPYSLAHDSYGLTVKLVETEEWL